VYKEKSNKSREKAADFNENPGIVFTHFATSIFFHFFIPAMDKKLIFFN
jgi:hypothetical protein